MSLLSDQSRNCGSKETSSSGSTISRKYPTERKGRTKTTQKQTSQYVESSMSEENTNALQENTFYRNRSWETSGLSDYGGNNS